MHYVIRAQTNFRARQMHRNKMQSITKICAKHKILTTNYCHCDQYDKDPGKEADTESCPCILLTNKAFHHH